MAKYIVRRGDRETAPLDVNTLREYAQAGKVRPTDLIRAENQTEWHPAQFIKGLFLAPATPTPPPPPASPPPVSPVPTHPAPVSVVETVHVVSPKRTSSLGVASMVLGIIALMLCWIPLVGMISLPLSGIGLLLGVVGLVVAIKRRGSSIGYPIAGTAIASLALVVGLIQVLVVSSVGVAASEAGTAFSEAQKKRTRTNQTVVKPADSNSPENANVQAPPVVPAPTPTSTATSTPTPPQREKEPIDEWVSAESAVKQGEVQVKVRSVRVGKIPLVQSITDHEGPSADSLIAIDIAISNTGKNKKVEYDTFMGARFAHNRDYATLRDNFDNAYKRIDFGAMTKAKGAVESESIYPGKSITDVLVFEEPVTSVKYLNLELPAENFGGTGMLRLRIPAYMIKWNK